MPKVCIPIKKEEKDEMISLLSAIEIKAQNKNQTFNWYLTKSSIKNYDYVAVVKVENVNRAHKIGLLITKKYRKKGYYWVKER